MEDAVTVHARHSDADVVGQTAKAAQQSYKDISGRDVKIDVQCTLAKDRCVSRGFRLMLVLFGL